MAVLTSAGGSHDSLSGFRDHSRWIPVALFGVLVLVVAGIFAARPAYRYFKTRRAGKLVQQAAAQIDLGNYDIAKGPLSAALTLAPELPEVIRQSARYSTHFLLPQSLQYWEMLESTGAATEADVRQHIGVALDLQRTDVAGRALVKLRSMSIREPESWLLLLRHDAQRADLDVARANVRAALNRFPSDPRFVLAAGRMLFLQPESPDDEARGRALLWSLAVGSARESTDAVRMLVLNPKTNPADQAVLAALLKKKPDPSVEERLLIDEIDWKLHPDRHPGLIRTEFESVQAASNLTDRIRIADWLSNHGADAEAVQLLPVAVARTNLNALEYRLQALANLRRWDEIESDLAHAESNTDPTLRDTFKGLTAAQTGRTNDALVYFDHAIASAGGEPRRLFLIASAAERCGRPEAAVRAWSALLDSPTFAVKAGQAMLRLLATQDDLPSTVRAFQKLLTFDPTNLDLQRDLALTQALIGSRLVENRDLLATLLKQRPNDAGLLHALALIELKLRNPAGALDHLDRLPVTYEDAVIYRVIRVAVLGANQQRVRARELAAPLAGMWLRNAEQELIADWLPKGR